MGGEMAVCLSLVVQCKAVPRREGGRRVPSRHAPFRIFAEVHRNSDTRRSERQQQPPPRRRNHGVNRIGSTLDRHHSHVPQMVHYARACYHTIGKRGKMKVI